MPREMIGLFFKMVIIPDNWEIFWKTLVGEKY